MFFSRLIRHFFLISLFLILSLFSSPLFSDLEQFRVDDFTTDTPSGLLPPGWGIQKFFPIFGDDPRSYVEFNSKSNYIHLRTGPRSSYLIGNRTEWNLFQTPTLRWDWKVGSFPEKGNIKSRATDDAVGSFCLAHGVSAAGFKESLCYLFGTEEKKGEHFAYYQNPAVHYIVLRSKESGEGSGKWFTEHRNVLSDFLREFGHEPPPSVYLAIWIDSNNTRSEAEIFYRNIYFSMGNP